MWLNCSLCCCLLRIMLIIPCARGFPSWKFTTTQCTSSTWFMRKDSICFFIYRWLIFLVVQITRKLCMQHVYKLMVLDQNKVLAHRGKGQEWWSFLVFQSNVIYKNHEHLLSRCQSRPSQSNVNAMNGSL